MNQHNNNRDLSLFSCICLAVFILYVIWNSVVAKVLPVKRIFLYQCVFLILGWFLIKVLNNFIEFLRDLTNVIYNNNVKESEPTTRMYYDLPID